jgi:hypothetical protein
MPRITLDAPTIAKLTQSPGALEVCDEQGKVVGTFRPKLDPEKYGPLEPQVGEEELRRREKSDAWYTTAEVLAHLRKLEQEGR